MSIVIRPDGVLVTFPEFGQVLYTCITVEDFVKNVKEKNALITEPESPWIGEYLDPFVETIEKYGVLLPIIVDKNWKIIDGVRRTKAIMLIYRNLAERCKEKAEICDKFEEFKTRPITIFQLLDVDIAKVDKRTLTIKLLTNFIREPVLKILEEHSLEIHRRFFRTELLINWVLGLALELASPVEKVDLEQGRVPNRIVREISKLIGIPETTIDHYIRVGIGVLKTGKGKVSVEEEKKERPSEEKISKKVEEKKVEKEQEVAVTTGKLLTVHLPSGRGVLTKYAQLAGFPDKIIDVLKRNNLIDVVLKKLKKDEIKVLQDLWIQVGENPEEYVKAVLEYIRSKEESKKETEVVKKEIPKPTKITEYTPRTISITLKDVISQSMQLLTSRNIVSETLCKELANVMIGIFFIPLSILKDSDEKLRESFEKFFSTTKKIDEILQIIYTSTNPDKVISALFSLGDLIHELANIIKTDVVKYYQEVLTEKQIFG